MSDGLMDHEEPAGAACEGGDEPLPPSITGYVWRHSGKHQVVLSILSTMVFLLSIWPLEIQRRIVNDAISTGSLPVILWLSIGYLGIAVLEGGLKVALNLYRGWVSETAVRHLRATVFRLGRGVQQADASSEENGVGIALVLSEAEPVGNFVGISLSEPLLQSGILVSVLGYMAFLRLEFALASLLVFLPQLVIVPMMQRAINRRAATRIRTLRRISGGMIADGGNGKADDAAQTARFDAVFALNMSIYALKFGMNFLMNLMHHVGIAVVLGVGGWSVVHGRIDVGAVVAFISGLTKLVDPWGDLINWYREATVSSVKYRLIETAARHIAGRAASADRPFPCLPRAAPVTGASKPSNGGG